MSVIYGNPVMIGGGDIKISRVLDENSWIAIKLVSSLGIGANYWSVGDCKEITMNGKVSDGLTLTNYTAWVFIIGFNHNSPKLIFFFTAVFVFFTTATWAWVVSADFIFRLFSNLHSTIFISRNRLVFFC